jgi:hypothetical protein
MMITERRLGSFNLTGKSLFLISAPVKIEEFPSKQFISPIPTTAKKPDRP